MKFELPTLFGINAFYILIIGMVLSFGLSAYNNSGYYHEDEHYQIIQFAEFKLGNTQEVSWEFKERIRSTLQPVIAMGLLTTFRFIGIQDPFLMAFILRMISAVFAIYVSMRMCTAFLKDVDKKYQGIFILLSCFLWFYPYLYIRFSSENWAGLFSMLALTYAHEKTGSATPRHFFYLGVLMGIAILFRYQMLFFASGLILWIVFVSKAHYTNVLITCLGICVVTVAGVVLDSVFYHTFTIALYNYFDANLIRGIASHFGVSPWYQIIIYIVQGSTYPIGVAIIACFVIGIIAKPRHIVYWVTTAFLLSHAIISHKELRFLFPLAGFIPLILVFGLSEINSRLKQILNPLWILSIFLILNICLLFMICFGFTRNGETKITDYIFHQYKGKNVNIISTWENGIFDPKINFKNHFYKAPNTTQTFFTSIWQEDFSAMLKKDAINVLVIANQDITGPKAQRKLRELGAVQVLKNDMFMSRYLLEMYDEAMYDKQLQLYLINQVQKK